MKSNVLLIALFAIMLVFSQCTSDAKTEAKPAPKKTTMSAKSSNKDNKTKAKKNKKAKKSKASKGIDNGKRPFYNPAKGHISNNKFWQRVRTEVGISVDDCKYIIRQLQIATGKRAKLSTEERKKQNAQIQSAYRKSVESRIGAEKAKKFFELYENK